MENEEKSRNEENATAKDIKTEKKDAAPEMKEQRRNREDDAQKDDGEAFADGEPRIKSPFISWLDNFWYHNKWKTIAVIFVVICAVIIAVQFITRTNYDGYLFYAGSRSISRTSQDATPEYQRMLNSLEKVVPDRDESGKTDISYETLFVLSPEEQKEVEESDGYEVNSVLLREDMNTLENRMLYDKYYVCFISEYVYDLYTEDDGANLFLPLEDYMPSGAEYAFYEGKDDAVYLSSTPFGDLDGIRNLPDDTLICLRRPVGSDTKDRDFNTAEEILRNILAYGAKNNN